jgi:trk system potassium uptake protein TrkH
MRPETLAVSCVLMMIGGGSAGTAGGIKVTTFLVLGFVVWAEIRGEPDVCAFGRRVSRDVQRQALAVVLLAVGFAAAGTLALLTVSDLALHDALFEASRPSPPWGCPPASPPACRRPAKPSSWS